MSIDNENDVSGLRRIARIVSETLALMRATTMPGMKTRELDAIGAEYLLAQGARSMPPPPWRAMERCSARSAKPSKATHLNTATRSSVICAVTEWAVRFMNTPPRFYRTMIPAIAASYAKAW